MCANHHHPLPQLMKFALNTEAFRSYIPIISDEVKSYFKRTPEFKGRSGTIDYCGSYRPRDILGPGEYAD